MFKKSQLHIDLEGKEIDVIGDRALMREVYRDLRERLLEPSEIEPEKSCGFSVGMASPKVDMESDRAND